LEFIRQIGENTDNWDLGKGRKSSFEYEYACLENLYSSPLFDEMSNNFGLDSLVVIEIAKAFTSDVSLPK
jgi:hypothetical protein